MIKAEDIGLKESQLKEILDILQSIPEIEEAILYGSRANGNFKKFSDIDISLKGESLGMGHLAKLEDKFYYSYLPFTFELTIYSELKNPELIDHIDRRGIKLF